MLFPTSTIWKRVRGWCLYKKDSTKRRVRRGDRKLHQALPNHVLQQKEGEDGKLGLGIRRATRSRSAFSDSAVANQNSYLKVLSSVSNVVSTKKTFHIFYNPREAEFAIPAGTSQDREIPSLCTTRIQMDKWKMFDAHLLRSPPLLRLNCSVHDFPLLHVAATPVTSRDSLGFR